MGSQTTSPSQIITLPQDGGAPLMLGETLSPDLHTGTGNFSVPIAFPPGPNGVQPQLDLVHYTESGNGHFGLTDPVASYRHGCDPPGGDKVRLANPARESTHSASSAPGFLNSQDNSIPFKDLSSSRIGQGHTDMRGMSVRRRSCGTPTSVWADGCSCNAGYTRTSAPCLALLVTVRY